MADCLSAYRGLEKFAGRSSLKTWLHRITVNASLTKLRKLKRLAEQPIDDLLAELDRYECRIEAPWPYLIPLETVLENAELSARVRERIPSLSDSENLRGWPARLLELH